MDVAFLELLSEKDYDYITVKEVCKRAGVSRSTFYLHYETMRDLVAECVAYLQNRLLRSYEGMALPDQRDLSTRPKDELYFITPDYLLPYLTFIKENAALFRVALDQADVLSMTESYDLLFRRVFSPILERFHIKTEERRFVMAFYIHGIIAIVNEWLQDGCSKPVESIASIIQSCIQIPSDQS